MAQLASQQPDESVVGGALRRGAAFAPSRLLTWVERPQVADACIATLSLATSGSAIKDAHTGTLYKVQQVLVSSRHIVAFVHSGASPPDLNQGDGTPPPIEPATNLAACPALRLRCHPSLMVF